MLAPTPASPESAGMSTSPSAWSLPVIGSKRLLHFSQGARRGQHHNFCAHHFAHKENLQGIDRIFTAQVIAATCDFLRQN